ESTAARTGTAAGVVPGGLKLKAGTVGQRGRRCGSAHARAKRSNDLGVRRFSPIQGSLGIAGGGIFTRRPSDSTLCQAANRVAQGEKVF
ncbi:MAG: hypothetical protein WCE38_06945, partial [Burkholderiales bacterium]